MKNAKEREQELKDKANAYARLEGLELSRVLGTPKTWEIQSIEMTIRAAYLQGACDGYVSASQMAKESLEWDVKRRAEAVKGAVS